MTLMRKKLIGLLFLALIICLILAMVSVVKPILGISPIKYLLYAVGINFIILFWRNVK